MAVGGATDIYDPRTMSALEQDMAGGPVVLCILDGWGYREDREANAPALAETPNYDALMAGQTPAMLACSGADVGLPDGQMGNSEVGHMNIGAGRIVWMDLPKIDAAIMDGDFAENWLETRKRSMARYPGHP